MFVTKRLMGELLAVGKSITRLGKETQLQADKLMYLHREKSALKKRVVALEDRLLQLEDGEQKTENTSPPICGSTESGSFVWNDDFDKLDIPYCVHCGKASRTLTSAERSRLYRMRKG